MLLKLILLLTIVPLVELYILLRLTVLWGSITLTLGLIVGTGILGATLARLEGLRVIRSMQEKLERGELPADNLLDGMMILVAAALLVTPGLITDTVGFLLLIPFTRRPIRQMVKGWIRRKMEEGEWAAHQSVEYRPLEEEPPPGYPPLEEDED
jgi:UPF0716 protein FxsA